MKILGRQNVLEATGRIARPLNRFEMQPLFYDLSPAFGDKRERERRIRAYEAAWARLQHEDPGYAADPEDQRFEQALMDWLRFHEGMLIGEIVPLLYQYLRDNPAAPERNLYDHILVDEYQDLNRAEQSVVDLLRGTAHLCIVGDDDQSLYSFKFAHPAGIRTFRDCHAGTTDHEITLMVVVKRRPFAASIGLPPGRTCLERIWSAYRSRDRKSRLSRINDARRLRSSIASVVKPP